ncbi:MAG: formate/nitrite transporter family protein [Actinomycetota bacterium]|nr:formate/nitrite transporter family protein [Actinomycetota bacterium]
MSDSGNLSDTGASRPAPGREETEIEEAFDRLVEEGRDRLERPLLSLCATGFLGGVDVGVGVLAYLVVEHETGQKLLAALAFTIGFIALLLARSELFTENFLVPVTAAAGGEGSLVKLARLWLVTLVMNLLGGLVIAAMTVVALPELRADANTAGAHYATLGVSWRSFLLAVLAGTVITLLTRMQHSTENLGVQLVPAIVMPFVLVGAQLFHSVLDSILMFAGLATGVSPYGWLDWAGALGWSAFGNIAGGLGLVTSIRLLRVAHRVQESRQDTD